MIGCLMNKGSISYSLLEMIIEDSKEYGLANYMKIIDKENNYSLVYLYDKANLIAVYKVNKNKNEVAAIYYFDIEKDDWICEILLL